MMNNISTSSNQKETLLDENHHVKGVVVLSGATFLVGIYSHESEDTIFIQSDDDPEPVYMSMVEAAVFYNLLKSCLER